MVQDDARTGRQARDLSSADDRKRSGKFIILSYYNYTIPLNKKLNRNDKWYFEDQERKVSYKNMDSSREV